MVKENQQFAETVYPGIGNLNNPAAGFVIRLSIFSAHSCPRLFALKGRKLYP
jgi:hypothetical protein